MQRVEYKFLMTEQSRVRSSLTWAVIFAVLVLPVRANAVSMGKLMSLPGFVAVVGAVARTNAAMRSAAENPMDDFRREAARQAVAAMPAAIIALAMEFKQGKLKDEDYPQVAALLGGFVDVNAADTYKKFLQRPDKNLIPK